MPVVKWSTLNKLGIDLRVEFPRLDIDALSETHHDYFIEINNFEQATLDRVIDQCSTCYGKLPCVCLTASECEEYAQLSHHINEAYQAFSLLENTPFRQSRNSFGFTASMIGLVNTGVSLVTFPVVLASCLTFLPAMAVGGYVYYRGKREEMEINRDYATTLLDERVTLINSFKQKIELKNQIARHSSAVTHEAKLTSVKKKHSTLPYEKVKEYKEKRGILGNAFSHCLVPLSSSAGMIISLLKFGVVAGLIGLSGPAVWGIAIGVGLCVGGYFAYKRYKNLTYKKKLETCFHKLTHDKRDLELQNAALKNKRDQLINAPRMQLPRPSPIVKAKINQQKHALAQYTLLRFPKAEHRQPNKNAVGLSYVSKAIARPH